MLELDRIQGAPSGVWTDQRMGIAGSVMVGALLRALYQGEARGELRDDGTVDVSAPSARHWRVAPLAPGPLRDEFEERAGVLEAGGLPRDEAEIEAARELGLLQRVPAEGEA